MRFVCGWRRFLHGFPATAEFILGGVAMCVSVRRKDRKVEISG